MFSKMHYVTQEKLLHFSFSLSFSLSLSLSLSIKQALELEAREPLHTFIYVDEAGFNLAKGRRHGGNCAGQRATTVVPGQRGENVTLCAAISVNGVLTHIPLLGPCTVIHNIC